MIKIEITDITSETAKSLRKIAKFLEAMADESRCTSDAKSAQEPKSSEEETRVFSEDASMDADGFISFTAEPEVQVHVAMNNHAVPVPDFMVGNPTLPQKIEVLPGTYGAELDADGLPWDARIHSRAASKTSDNRWRVKRGIESKEIKKVEAELRALMAVPRATPTVAVPSVPVLAAGLAVPMPPPPPAEVSPFPALISKITKATTSGQLTMAQILEVVKKTGAEDIPVLGARPDLCVVVSNELDKLMGV